MQGKMKEGCGRLELHGPRMLSHRHSIPPTTHPHARTHCRQVHGESKDEGKDGEDVDEGDDWVSLARRIGGEDTLLLLDCSLDELLEAAGGQLESEEGEWDGEGQSPDYQHFVQAARGLLDLLRSAQERLGGDYRTGDYSLAHPQAESSMGGSLYEELGDDAADYERPSHK